MLKDYTLYRAIYKVHKLDVYVIIRISLLGSESLKMYIHFHVHTYTKLYRIIGRRFVHTQLELIEFDNFFTLRDFKHIFSLFLLVNINLV